MSTSENSNELRFALGSTGMTLSMIILKDESESLGQSVQLEETSAHMIIMRRPDGTVVSLRAEDITSNDEEDLIEYTITDPDLLSQRGRWQYWASYVRDGSTRITYDRFGFWVT